MNEEADKRFSVEEVDAVAPPPCHGGIASSSSLRAHSAPMPVGP